MSTPNHYALTLDNAKGSVLIRSLSDVVLLEGPHTIKANPPSLKVGLTSGLFCYVLDTTANRAQLGLHGTGTADQKPEPKPRKKRAPRAEAEP